MGIEGVQDVRGMGNFEILKARTKIFFMMAGDGKSNLQPG
jgi:hypothetical protein